MDLEEELNEERARVEQLRAESAGLRRQLDRLQTRQESVDKNTLRVHEVALSKVNALDARLRQLGGA